MSSIRSRWSRSFSDGAIASNRIAFERSRYKTDGYKIAPLYNWGESLNLSEIDGTLNDDLLAHIFSFMTPEDLYHVSQVSKRWSRTSSLNIIWKQFCSVHWTLDVLKKDSPFLSKLAYLQWIRNISKQLKEAQNINQKIQYERKLGRTNFGSTIKFFWPSFSAFRERFSLKVLVVGDKSVGKTCLIHRFTEGRFPPVNTLNFPAIINNDQKFKMVEVGGNNVEIQIIETDLESTNLNVSAMEWKFSVVHACLVCFDLSDINSFIHVQRVLKKIHKKSQEIQLELFLVGTKSDVAVAASAAEANRLNSLAKSFANSFSINFFNTSSKDDSNVTKCFSEVASSIFKSFAWPNYIPSESTLKYMTGTFVQTRSPPRIRSHRISFEPIGAANFSPPHKSTNQNNNQNIPTNSHPNKCNIQ